MGSAVLSRVSLLIYILRPNLVLSYRIAPDFRGGVHLFMGNGQKRELPILFWPKTDVPENKNSGKKCCWSYLIGQHTLSPVFGQKRPGAPDYSYFAQLAPVFGHFMFLSRGLLDYWMLRRSRYVLIFL